MRPRFAGFLLTLVCVIACSLGQNRGFAQNGRPVFQSKTVTPETAGHSVKIEADIRGAKDLYLVATDAGDGYSFDHCDWAVPKLVAKDKVLKLTDLKWKEASSGYGRVAINRNCTGGELSINDKKFDFGIGTHANSYIHFELPKNHSYTTFSAIGGIDNSGSDQGAGHQASVQFLVFTQKPPQRYLDSRRSVANPVDHEIGKALEQFDVHEDLEIGLFASEPMMVNPTNIDIDHLGRVWVCEVINYRGRRNTRKEGDRILILEDTDSDGKADKQTVFYQGRDIDSVHGICVLGNRVIVSAGSEVFYLLDQNGDSRADKKEILFTGIQGTQHDHGIHAFVFGPDGKLYFNFGNSGREIKDKNGKPIVDAAGQTVNDRTFPYKQGMIFRCNLDGSDFETLAWNFRNNWEVCVDSIGRMWQSDNDDDGNRGVRINFVMPFGNYGYLDEMTGAGWRAKRTGMSDQIPQRHWHLNDPGVVPNLLQTGAGSPTGICFYEGDSLPKAFHNQIIHCDAGPSIVRAYPIENDGFGYKATTLNIMDGAKYNKWFRPSDVCVAPDGSLLVADWYDPGVGGHGMGDIERGRLFRVTAKGNNAKYAFEKPDFSTTEGACKALQSPNQATRFLAWQTLFENGRDSIKPLQKLLANKNPHLAARAFWLLSKLELTDTELTELYETAISDSRQLIQEVAIKALVQYQNPEFKQKFINKLYGREAPSLPKNVARELLLGRSWRNPGMLKASAEDAVRLAKNIGNDRWALEALGISLESYKGESSTDRLAVSDWNQALPLILKMVDDNTLANMIWRSRSKQTPKLLGELILSKTTNAADSLRYFRALDFQEDADKKDVILSLAFDSKIANKEKRNVVMRESLSRIRNAKLTPSQMQQIASIVSGEALPLEERIKFISQFGLTDQKEVLLNAASDPNSPYRVAAAATLIDLQQGNAIRQSLIKAEEIPYATLLISIASVPKKEAVEILGDVATSSSFSLEQRKLATRRLGDLYGGCQLLISWAEKKNYDRSLEPAMIAALHNARWNDIGKKAKELFPIARAKGDKPLPKISKLIRRRGDVKRGLELFKNQATCATCHLVNGMENRSALICLKSAKSYLKRPCMNRFFFPRQQSVIILRCGGSLRRKAR